MSPTTPTMVSQGFLDSSPPRRMCLPTGDSFFHQRSAMRLLTSATLALGAIAICQIPAGDERQMHQIEIAWGADLVHALRKLVEFGRAAFDGEDRALRSDRYTAAR